MNDKIVIRKAEQTDSSLLENLYQKAFPDEDLCSLVIELLNDKQNTLSLCALSDGTLVGHIAFSKCYAAPKEVALALLAPMAVLPEYQRKGIGNSLIKEGFNQLKKDHIAKVLVLGDPNYYSRSGFAEETAILPAYKIPDEWTPAWQSCALENSSVSLSGKINVSKPWQRKELWS